MTRSRSRSNPDKQIKTSSEQLRQKTREGYDIIKNKDRPSKIKTIYQQIKDIENRFQQLLEKQSGLNSDCTEQQKLFKSLNNDWLPYIHGQKIMSNQQSFSTVSASEAQPPVIVSLPTDQNSCLSEGKDNTSRRTLNPVTRNGSQTIKQRSDSQTKIYRTVRKHPHRKEELKK